MIDINDKQWYGSLLGYDDDLTRERLIEMNELGMEEIGVASFGIRGVMSGLYIEYVWSKSKERWTDYINWVKELKLEKLGSID